MPQDWREADVVPLFKKGSKKKSENYRPVSLTCIVGKILESILKDVIFIHLNKHGLIKDSQHGFTSGRSCLTNLLDFFEAVTKYLDEGSDVDLIYLDFCKAFDKVPHKRLLIKLEALGIDNKISGWIASWLANRRQRVVVEGEYSGWDRVISGVPQGSVLGPVLFIIYINDIDDGILSKINKFADDCKLGRKVTNQEDIEILRQDLEKLSEWADRWQMKFNVEKCAVLHMGKSEINRNYEINHTQLKTHKVEKDLGILVDGNMKFSEHCNSVVNSANATLGMIKRSISCKSNNMIVRLYKALVRPKLEYCVQAWRPFLKKDIEKLETVQRRATRMIDGLGTLSYSERLKRTGLTTLEERRDRGDLIEVFKIVRGFSRVDSKYFFNFCNIRRTRGHSYKMNKDRSRLDIRKFFFSQRVVNKWNSLPVDVVEALSVNSFKNRYDKFLLQMYR